MAASNGLQLSEHGLHVHMLSRAKLGQYFTGDFSVAKGTGLAFPC